LSLPSFSASHSLSNQRSHRSATPIVHLIAPTPSPSSLHSLTSGCCGSDPASCTTNPCNSISLARPPGSMQLNALQTMQLQQPLQRMLVRADYRTTGNSQFEKPVVRNTAVADIQCSSLHTAADPGLERQGVVLPTQYCVCTTQRSLSLAFLTGVAVKLLFCAWWYCHVM
jgi:hypothetical protein